MCSMLRVNFTQLIIRGQVDTLESPLGNEYLNSTLFPTLPTSSEIPQQLENGSDSLPPFPPQSQADLGASGPTNRAQANLIIKRSSSTGPTTNTNGLRQSTLGASTAKIKRTSGIGVSSSHGRLFKVLGDFFLLSGRIEDAAVWYAFHDGIPPLSLMCLHRYTEAIALFKSPQIKSPQDTPWHASALEGLATVVVIEAWLRGHGLVCLIATIMHDARIDSMDFLGRLFQQRAGAMVRHLG